MPTAPSPVSKATGRHQMLYQNTLQEAAAAGAVLMGMLVEAARQALQTQEALQRLPREREALATASNQLRRLEAQLCAQYPQALLQAFAVPQGGKKSQVLAAAGVQFDDLELMDPVQVQTSVTLARIQQGALQAVDASLFELNTLMCSLQGMGTVRPEHNPLRPEVYVNALQNVVEKTQVPPDMALLWLGAMATALGPLLRTRYLALCASLRKQGVLPVAYAAQAEAPQQMASPSQAVQPTVDTASKTQPAGRDAALLTLDKLRQLLAGELAPLPTINRVEEFAAQFAQQFEGGQADAGLARSDFDATVPAALEALTEMKQVERVMQSLEDRRSLGAGVPSGADAAEAHSIEGQRLALRRSARDVAQALSLEVVSLMVDNMAHDPRLLEPVRGVIRNLEPALLRLALVDPRFFTDKQHPARRLLHELTHRSLAFESPQASGFDTFVGDLQNVLSPLFRAPIDSAEVFEAKLETLRQHWSRAAEATQKERALAVDVLQHAEARNLLAEKIARTIVAHPDAAKVPHVVIDFLCGPWAQVVAQARIKQGAGSSSAEHFEALVPALLWSAHPELARTSPSKLTRLVPRLLATLREGLDTIHYPGTRTSVFLEALMAIHQQVFRAPTSPAAPVAVDARRPEVALSDRVRALVDDEPWIAPEEARASNFMALLEEEPAAPARVQDVSGALPTPPQERVDGELVLGSWVEMWNKDQWQRTQLTWASPHGTLFLFTSVFGSTHSMTRRSRDKLLASGHLRLVSGQAVDEGALDAVVQTAMRNSVGSVL